MRSSGFFRVVCASSEVDDLARNEEATVGCEVDNVAFGVHLADASDGCGADPADLCGWVDVFDGGANRRVLADACGGLGGSEEGEGDEGRSKQVAHGALLLSRWPDGRCGKNAYGAEARKL